ncbi:MAG: 5-(carboxyamino)imidazole ribonucleotide mutase [Clostridia bacterium]|jgi:5-(carboxyamino)imidazole ribonucleotide mutase|nr:5-(carboxyamino)imidazole ribonucleotide mutase [Clostridia bacterium]
MGSKSDLPVMKKCLEVLDDFGVVYETKILSAHRMPDATSDYAKNIEKRGIQVIIAGAGGAAHLPGTIAANTVMPVIGVPLASSDLQGLDALYSIVQMPAGVPVACMAIGTAGAKNAAILAVKILSLSSSKLKKKMEEYKAKLAQGSR